ncbi:phytase [Rhodotorula diobovata]|uniref:Phytase A n=1 Tax=Rhodotorula diobovata TaxID=5288 RepID=A0A5C5FSZ8_9BASI|nr:phytase [Rhodotorula diobovata]
MLASLIATWFVLVHLAVFGHGAAVPAVISDPLPAYIARHLGPYSPWYAAGEYLAPPSSCELEQANILQRHGARFPTANAGKKYAASVAKLRENATSLSAALQFVRSYTYALGADQLTPLGAQQSREAGVEAYKRYKGLVTRSGKLPFVRSDSQQRVVDSAGNWTAGFFQQLGEKHASTVLVLSNASGSNDTLDDNNCPSAPDLSGFEQSYLATFLSDAAARLDAAAPGAHLTPTDALNFMQICGFESQYTQRLSPWCKLFSRQEFVAGEYYYDLDKYYGNGLGNPLGPVQGVGYVNELLSRLTGDRSYVLFDETQVNQTLARSQATFPLGSRAPALFADFSHDNEIASIVAAIGLKKPAEALPAGGPPEGEGEQVWVTSEIVPFSGRLVTERLSCDGEDYVRFLINDQLQVPTFCAGADVRTGLCRLDDFVASQSYARASGNGDYLKCGYKPLSG